MNKRQFLKGMAATAAGILVPGHVLSGQYEFHQRVSGLRAGSLASNNGYSSPVIASDSGVDWLGEVPASELITGDQLASLIGLTAGISQHSDADWLKVGLNGTELFIAKKPFRSHISWDSINAVNAVYGNRVVSINGQEYKIRLMKGANSDPAIDVTVGHDVPSTHGSEWNKIFYRLTENNANQNSAQPFTNLADYTDNELSIITGSGNGVYSLCQETIGGRIVLRGFSGSSYLDRAVTTSISWYLGWRPVLEKVS